MAHRKGLALPQWSRLRLGVKIYVVRQSRLAGYPSAWYSRTSWRKNVGRNKDDTLLHFAMALLSSRRVLSARR